MQRLARWLLGGAVATAIALAVPRAASAPSGSLEIYFIDVEGGAATLIVTPKGESVLVDSGWPREDGRDAKRIAHAARDVAGLTQIDHALTTHWHVDHYGGIEALTKLMPVRHFWDRGIPDTLPEDPRFPMLIAAYRRASGGRSTALRPGDTLPLAADGGPIELRVVAVNERVIGEEASEAPIGCDRHPSRPKDPSDNARSVALLLRHRRFEFLNCGDLTWNIEHKLVCPKNRVGKVDLWQVTHHGADQSNNPALVEAIEPVCAVMCNGPRKGGAAATFATLKRAGLTDRLYQLHRNVTTGPEDNTAPERIANLEENCSGEFFRVRLSPEGDRFVISRGADRPLRTFAVR